MERLATFVRTGSIKRGSLAKQDSVRSKSSLTTETSETAPSEETDVFYDAVDNHDGMSPSSPRGKKLPETPKKRQFPMTLAKNHHYVTPEEFERYRKTDSNRLRNTYSEPPASQFQVRGPQYLSQSGKNMKHLKVASQSSVYELIGVNMFRSPRKLVHMSKEIKPLARFFASHPAQGKDEVFPRFLVINWNVAPMFGKECHVCVHVFQLKEGINRPNLESAFRRFRASTDEERNGQFKWLGKIVEGPRTITATMSALGAERPVLIGNQLTTTYCEGSNFLEITNDVSSSRIASANCGTILRNLNVVVMDMAWVLEGAREQDLPENILCSVRWIWNTVDELSTNLDETGELLVREDGECT